MKKIILATCILCVVSLCVLSAQTFETDGLALQAVPSQTEGSISSVERGFLRLGLQETAGLKQFGYDMLNAMVPSRSSIVNDDYVLGPGDDLRIYLWGDSVDFGTLKGYYEATVDLDGGLYITPAGRLAAYGRTIKDVNRTLTEILNFKYSNITVEVAPARIRDFPVYVSGFVKNPGTVSVNGLWSVADVLGVSGGIVPEGSLRDIQVWRGGEQIAIDLYDLFIRGIPVSLTMQEGDVIYVPPVSKSVAITGQVKREGIYEMTRGETVGDLLTYAGGLQVAGAAYTVRIVTQDGTSVMVSEASSNIQDITSRIVHDGDLILLTPSNVFSSNIVEVAGAVHYPGIYNVEKTPMLSGLIERVELRYDADMAFGTIFRDDSRDEDSGIVFSPGEIAAGTADVELLPNDVIQFYTVERTYTQDPIRVTGLVERPEVISYEQGMMLLDLLQHVTFTRDISTLQLRLIRDQEVLEQIYLRDLLIKGDTSKNISLRPGDMAAVVENEDSENLKGVRVLGQVTRPGVYSFEGDLHLSDVLTAAGGYAEQAYPQALYLIRESVKTRQLEQLKKTITVTASELNALEASVAVKTDLSSAEKNIIAAQIEQQRSLLESAAENQGETLGRIALNIPATIESLKGSTADILLSEGDHIYIPERSEYVTIIGDIDSTIALPYEKNKKVKDYLFELGGLRSKDYTISIMKYNGKVVKEDNLFFGWSTIEGQTLAPGDVIIAVKKISIPAGTQLVEGLTQVTDSVYKVVYSLNALDFFGN